MSSMLNSQVHITYLGNCKRYVQTVNKHLVSLWYCSIEENADSINALKIPIVYVGI